MKCKQNGWKKKHRHDNQIVFKYCATLRLELKKINKLSEIYLQSGIQNQK